MVFVTDSHRPPKTVAISVLVCLSNKLLHKRPNHVLKANNNDKNKANISLSIKVFLKLLISDFIGSYLYLNLDTTLDNNGKVNCHEDKEEEEEGRKKPSSQVAGMHNIKTRTTPDDRISKHKSAHNPRMRDTDGIDLQDIKKKYKNKNNICTCQFCALATAGLHLTLTIIIKQQ
ncbi:hypothetical protein J3Q64DRAFT_1696639 [Phycomyces blakesleeanus]|uniref:Uncharacterized protein n=2 Tax=Phycomyces blakesleeanus TaxID=4837 RepID=A0A162XSN1_PHYB8|nr:hypothetical protein PHYBLDRAFT_59860 [Phycomyces blakesleeanus NRRL 1555(-)]OAD76325.1 hypothetical protein PHYBLDRAFT_59860 [Phycomyces blakesleeanus NRRL 1555(-)]|eukprot:XP_018294365.1 hypothetical protein PHYBLDRAFT_59860 [Phycomyces blakesleeanus NRRL 1555(-)]